MSKYIDAEKLTKFEETLADIIVSSQGLCTYEACKDMAKSEAPFLITSLQQEQPELPPIGYAETYYQKGLHDGIIKGQTEILKGLEEIEKRKAEPVLVIKEQELPEVGLEKEIDWLFDNYGWECFEDIDTTVFARHFYELGLNARKEK